MNLDDQRAELKDIRTDIAERVQQLANRVLDARLLRVRLEGEYRRGEKGVMCSSDKKAEDAAKVDVEYIQWERDTARLEYELKIVEATAESLKYAIEKSPVQEAAV